MRLRWTKEMKRQLTEMYPNMENHIIAEKMGLRYAQVCSQGNVLGLHKSPAFLSKMATDKLKAYGSKYYFKKGQIPSNKGKKIEEWMSKKGIENYSKNWFKKGEKPAVCKPLGSIRLNKEGYYEIKVEESKRWRYLHRYNWEKVNGTIPKGKIIKFKDGNRLNCDVSNLFLSTRGEHMVDNAFYNFPTDVRKIIRAKAVMTRMVHKLERRAEK